MAKKEDPWADDKIESTLEERVQDSEDIAHAVEAIDVSFQDALNKILSKDGARKLTDTYIQEGHKNYEEATAEAVRELIESHYTLSHKFSPIKGILKAEGLDKHPLVKKVLENVYMAHKRELYQGVGRKDFGKYVEGQKQQNQVRVKAHHINAAVGDIDPKKHTGGVIKYLKGKYQVDDKKLSKPLVEKDVQGIMASEMTKKDQYVAQELRRLGVNARHELDKDYLHQEYKAHGK